MWQSMNSRGSPPASSLTTIHGLSGDALMVPPGFEIFLDTTARHEAHDLRGVPMGIRTPVTAVKGRCPRPLDDGDLKTVYVRLLPEAGLVEVTGIEPVTSC